MHPSFLMEYENLVCRTQLKVVSEGLFSFILSNEPKIWPFLSHLNTFSHQTLKESLFKNVK